MYCVVILRIANREVCSGINNCYEITKRDPESIHVHVNCTNMTQIMNGIVSL